MIDTHSHINASVFDEDRAEMLHRAQEAGVSFIVVPDIEPSARAKLKAVVEAHEFLMRGVGIHPHHAGEVSASDLADVDAQCTEHKVVAIGEIGLDYYYDFCSPDVQKSYFREQIRIAKAHDLPIIVHNREADQDVLDIIENEQDGSLRGVLHCFSSDIKTLDRALALGMHISFTGNVTFKKSTLNNVVQRVPIDRMMIETDAPFMTPVPHRGSRNEPTYVRLVAEKIAEITRMPLSEVLTSTTATARKFFGLVALFLIWSTVATAQPSKPRDEDYENDTDYEIAIETYEKDLLGWSKFIKPRTVAFGVTIGSNTVVQQQTFTQQYERAIQGTTTPQRWPTKDIGKSRSFSYEGLLSLGATVLYQASDVWAFEVTYLNTENVGSRALFALPPIITNIAEAVMHYSLNPYNMVNFLPQIGASFANTNDGEFQTNQFGFNIGMGLGVNIPTSFGLFYPMVNVRFNVMFGTSRDAVTANYNVLQGEGEGKIEDRPGVVADPNVPGLFFHYNPDNPSQLSQEKADITTIFSIPRLSIMFFPSF